MGDDHSFAVDKMIILMDSNVKAEQKILDWLYSRLGQKVRPQGRLKDLATAENLIGTSQARIQSIVDQGVKHLQDKYYDR